MDGFKQMRRRQKGETTPPPPTPPEPPTLMAANRARVPTQREKAKQARILAAMLRG
jgi:hypothetical protein